MAKIPHCLTVLLLASVVTVAPLRAFPPIVTEENLRDAILSTTAFSGIELAEMDVNFDGTVDVADLVFVLNGSGELALDGYTWLVLASFAPEPQNESWVAYEYCFVLAIQGDSAVVTTIDELDPTKGLLRQNLSGPGELPGVHRPDYTPSQVVPDGTMFTKTEMGLLATLTSEGRCSPNGRPDEPYRA